MARPALSPWCDLEIGNDDIVAKADADKLLSKPLLELFRQCWLGGTGISYTDPRVSLLHADLAGLAPTSLHWGEAWSRPVSTSGSVHWLTVSTPS